MFLPWKGGLVLWLSRRFGDYMSRILTCCMEVALSSDSLLSTVKREVQQRCDLWLANVKSLQYASLFDYIVQLRDPVSIKSVFSKNSRENSSGSICHSGYSTRMDIVLRIFDLALIFFPRRGLDWCLVTLPPLAERRARHQIGFLLYTDSWLLS